MLARIKIKKGSKVSIVNNSLYIENGENILHLVFSDLETIEAVENNLSHIACAMRAEQTMKEGVENGKETE